jgi:twitching motility two-component system response regulator PilG
MSKVLIVDDSQELLKPIVMGLKKHESDFEVLTANNGEEAIVILKKEPITTLVTDLYMPKMDGLELLAYMTRNHPRIPCVVMTAFGSPEVQRILDQRAIFHYLEKPIDMAVLSNTILDAIAQFEQGKSLAGLSVAGFLQLIEMEKKSCILEATSTRKEKGRFFFLKGSLHDAELADLDADKAAITMIGWKNATLRVKSLSGKTPEKNIGFGLKTLILEGARIKDGQIADGETERPTVSPGTNTVDLLYQAKRKAESNENKQALQILATLLKQNPKNPEAWLWYSRVAGNIKAVIAALDNAHILAKEAPETIEARKRLQFAFEKGCPKTGEVNHCPFCWTPYTGKPSVCYFCQANLVVRPGMFNGNNSSNQEIIDQAIHRYTRIVLVEKKVQVHYHLALAHLNRGQLEEGLDQLYKTKQLAPENSAFREQLKILLNYLANIELPEAKENKTAQPSRSLASSSDRRNKTILVVEDSNTTRKVITIILKNEGFDVVEAKDGIEALARFNEIIPDMVLLDIIMPGMDGYEVLATLKKNKTFRNIPVVMLTGRDSLLDKLKGKMSGSDDYLTKPFTPEQLMEQVQKHLK